MIETRARGAPRSCAIVWSLLVVVLIAAVADLALTMRGALAPLDRSLTVQAYSFEPRWLTPAMVAFTLLSDDPPLDLFALAVALWAYRRRQTIAALATVAVAAVARVVGVVMKDVVRRPRPFLHAPPHPLAVLHGFGYPSGNALLATAILGFGGAVIVTLLLARRWRWLAAIVCALLILCMGWSRVYLGFHWVNDVVGGYLDGAVIAVAGWIAQQRLRTRFL
jgi:undecaprenyl-diphosphatase